MNIRQEQPADYDSVYQVVKEAFAGAQHSDGNEQELVVALRKSDAFIPELSLVATEAHKVVGHILFTRAFVGRQEVLALAPLSVIPAYQKRGIGLALIERGHSVAARLGFPYSVVLGHATYYPKAGYQPASRFGIKAPFEVQDENFMAIRLVEGNESVGGVIEYNKEFGI